MIPCCYIAALELTEDQHYPCNPEVVPLIPGHHWLVDRLYRLSVIPWKCQCGHSQLFLLMF